MSFFDKNLAALQTTNAELAGLLGRESQKSRTDSIFFGDLRFEEASLVENATSKDNHFVLTATIENVVHRFNSAYRPLSEAETWAGQYEWKNSKIVASVFGLGNGYCVRELLKSQKNTDTILIFEPSQNIFRFVMEHYDLSDILAHKSVHITVLSLNLAQYFEQLGRHVHWSNAECQLIGEHPQYGKAFPKAKELFYSIIRKNNTRVYTDRNTEIYFGKIMVDNTIKNMKFIKNSMSLERLHGKLQEDIPAIIVSAGPSLDKNIDKLQAAKNKALIIATDSAVPALLRHSIIPDFAVSIDAEKSLHCFAAPESRKIPLLCEIQSTHGIIKEQTGKLIYLHCHPYFTRLYEQLGEQIPTFSVGGSVATAAFSICEYLDIKKIALIGQDLSYKDGSSHVGGEVHTILGEEGGQCELEGYYGGMVKSRHDWQGYLAWFEEEILKIQNRILVVNATEGGAKIHGAHQMPLQNFIDEYCKTQTGITELLDSFQMNWDSNKRELLIRYLSTGLKELEKLASESDKTRILCTMVIDEYDKTKSISEAMIAKRKEVESYNKKVNGMSVYSLVDACIREVTVSWLQDVNLYKEDKKEEFMQFFRSAKEIHTAICETADKLYPLLKEVYQWYLE